MSELSDSGNTSSSEGPGLISSASAPARSQVTAAWAESSDTQAEASVSEQVAPDPQVTVELTSIEARVLGSLVEKSFLTPDVYPMTTNAMTAACNQKTNRDPVVDYSAVQVDSTLLELRQRNLVRRVHAQGARSTKHRQTLDEALSLTERQLALISVLLLRGPQTIGELRLRTERHNVGFDDLEAVVGCLESLAGRSNPLVRQLARQPGHKENRWQHLLGDPEEVATEVDPNRVDDESANQQVTPTDHVGQAVAAQPTATTPNPVEQRVASLESEVATLRQQLATLAAKLGEPLE